MQDKPMLRNTCKTFDGEQHDSRILKHNRKFPVGILVLGISGWLFQIVSLLEQDRFWHVVCTFTIVPFMLVSTSGLSVLHVGQKVNNSNNCDKNTINFGCRRRFSFTGNLKEKK